MDKAGLQPPRRAPPRIHTYKIPHIARSRGPDKVLPLWGRVNHYMMALESVYDATRTCLKEEIVSRHRPLHVLVPIRCLTLRKSGHGHKLACLCIHGPTKIVQHRSARKHRHFVYGKKNLFWVTSGGAWPLAVEMVTHASGCPARPTWAG